MPFGKAPSNPTHSVANAKMMLLMVMVQYLPVIG